jgi:hypothetical protein
LALATESRERQAVLFPPTRLENIDIVMARLQTAAKNQPRGLIRLGSAMVLSIPE